MLMSQSKNDPLRSLLRPLQKAVRADAGSPIVAAKSSDSAFCFSRNLLFRAAVELPHDTTEPDELSDSQFMEPDELSDS